MLTRDLRRRRGASLRASPFQGFRRWSACSEGFLQDHELEAIARMQIAGCSVSAIAAAVDKTPATIRKVLASPPEPLREKLEKIHGLVLKATATHHYEMLGMLDQARDNIRSALFSSEDEKERNRMSTWLVEHVMPKPQQAKDTNVNLQASPEMMETLTSIAKSAQALAEARSGVSTLRVRSGKDALPSPVLEAIATHVDGA